MKKTEQNILFFGKFFPKGLINSVYENSKGLIGFSNHNYEMSFIKGLSKQEGAHLICLSVPGVFSYPYHNTAFYTHSECYVENNILYKSIGFCNFAILNKISIIINSIFVLKRIFKHFDGKNITIFVNTPNLFLLLPLFILKFCSKYNLKILLSVPDIPGQILMMDKIQGLKKYFISFFNHITMYLSCQCDYLILLTDAMREYFTPNIPYIVIEGLIDCDKTKENIVKNEYSIKEKQFILYTGTLRKIFGIMNLVEAYLKSNCKDLELWICGSGEASVEIVNLSKKHPSIKYLGLLTPEESLLLQRKATILVNPRTSKGEYTKYSFPSKTLEYMLSGRPIIMNKLPGIPYEYYKYIYIPHDESIEELSFTIEKVYNLILNNQENKSKLEKEFILSNKTSEIQIKKILDFIKDK